MICAVTTHTGGITKAFILLDQLANLVHGKYGKNWKNYVRTVSKDGYPTKHSGAKKPTLGTDVQGIFPYIGHFLHNNTNFTVFDSPHDGSCMYHLVSVVLQPSYWRTLHLLIDLSNHCRYFMVKQDTCIEICIGLTLKNVLTI